MLPLLYMNYTNYYLEFTMFHNMQALLQYDTGKIAHNCNVNNNICINALFFWTEICNVINRPSWMILAIAWNKYWLLPNFALHFSPHVSYLFNLISRKKYNELLEQGQTVCKIVLCMAQWYGCNLRTSPETLWWIKVKIWPTFNS
jgi:hypothetical protein